LKALGDLSRRVDDLDGARAFYDRALPIFEQIGARLGAANTLKALGDLSRRVDDLDGARAFYDRALPIFEQIGDRLGAANTLKALGDLSLRVDDLDGAHKLYRDALHVYVTIQNRASAANCWRGLARVADAQGNGQAVDEFYCKALAIQRELTRQHPSYKRVLDAWEREHATLVAKHGVESACLSDVPPPDPAAEFARQIMALYQQGGAAAVRQALAEAGASAEDINGLIAQLETAAAQAPADSSAGAVSTLPAETVQTLCANTVAVRTAVPDKLDEWQAQLTSVRVDWLTQGADWELEVAFIEALLAVLRGESPVLAESNPYAGVVAQVVKAVAG
ncbi:MAG: tetratricopeptide repeat protein, partial [Anaerolineae bacterium]|nr:tetratricopeptide repeat protein [Anaerolineae bacterium]